MHTIDTIDRFGVLHQHFNFIIIPKDFIKKLFIPGAVLKRMALLDPKLYRHLASIAHHTITPLPSMYLVPSQSFQEIPPRSYQSVMSLSSDFLLPSPHPHPPPQI
eukprot:603386_1